MLTSMTGFGRSLSTGSFGQLSVEVQSINRKYLDIALFLPRELSQYEPQIREWVRKRFLRGQISLHLRLLTTTSLLQRLPDTEFLRKMKNSWEEKAESLGYSSKEISLPFLLSLLPMESPPTQELDLKDLERCVQEALTGMAEMRALEGKALEKDFRVRLVLLSENLEKIETIVPLAHQKMREEWLAKMGEWSQHSEWNERIQREILFYAERMDISEEITRLHAHFSQFVALLESSERGIGRKMDFLLQEMGREINTIGSKSVAAAISHCIVEMKTELERMREQVQNVE